MDQEKLGKKIREIRKENNLTQVEFAKEFGVTYQAVSKWENGLSIPDIAILREICNRYRLDIKELLLEENSLEEKIKQPKKTNLVKLSIICIGSLLAFIILFVTIVYLKGDNNFEFKTLSSSCNNFTISGSIAYNKNKSSIYISQINYCGKKDTNTYNNINCTLYEIVKNNKTKITSYTYKNKQEKTLEEILKEVKFNIDDYKKTCKSYKENSLELEIDATNQKGEITTYKIPLKLEKNCSDN